VSVARGHLEIATVSVLDRSRDDPPGLVSGVDVSVPVGALEAIGYCRPPTIGIHGLLERRPVVSVGENAEGFGGAPAAAKLTVDPAL